MRVLLVEDEERLADTIARGLRREGMAVDVVLDGRSALDQDRRQQLRRGGARPQPPRGPRRRRLPRAGGPPVAGPHPHAHGGRLDPGPGHRTRPRGRRLPAQALRPQGTGGAHPRSRPPGGGPGAPVLSAGDLALDPARHVAERAGRDLGLTKKEFGVLEVLLSAEGRVVSAEELLEKVWDENTDPFTNVVRVTIMTLRRKIGDPPLIETVAGVGYKI